MLIDRSHIPFLVVFQEYPVVVKPAQIGTVVFRRDWSAISRNTPRDSPITFADLFWTGILTIMINLIMASAFASILIYAMDLLPNRIGLIGGLFYGLNFGLAGVSAAFLGVLADSYGIETVYQICSFLPLAGLLTWFLPRIDEGRGQ